MHGSLGTYIAHVIIRGVIYRFLFRLPITIVVIVGICAIIYIKSARVRKAMVRKGKKDD